MPCVFVAHERTPGETRVAATPETVRNMVKAGLEVRVAPGAGASAFIADSEFEAAGAKIANDLRAAYSEADVVLKVRELGRQDPLGNEVDLLKEGAIVIGFLAPYAHDATIRKMVERRTTSLPMELVPRITRAQKMDALSSQASIAGYKAALIAALNVPKYFPLLMTAAGTIKPARVLVMGAGVAGLQAIATAKRLGALVEATDIRPEVKEQVASLGGKFVDLPGLGDAGRGEGGYARELSAEVLAKQQAIVKEHVAAADVVITTALVPGRPAPKLVSAEMVSQMRAGSVIVDLAVEQGGNCELSELGKEVRKHGVLIVGHPNLPATMPLDASNLYARNVLALLQNILTKEGQLNIDPNDSVTGPTLLTHAGQCMHAPTAERLGLPPPAPPPPAEAATAVAAAAPAAAPAAVPPPIAAPGAAPAVPPNVAAGAPVPAPPPPHAAAPAIPPPPAVPAPSTAPPPAAATATPAPPPPPAAIGALSRSSAPPPPGAPKRNFPVPKRPSAPPPPPPTASKKPLPPRPPSPAGAASKKPLPPLPPTPPKK